MSDAISRQLSGIYRELIERVPFSEVAQVELSNADAFGHAKSLLITQCDIDGLELVSTFVWMWIIDVDGFRPLSEWPITQSRFNRDDFFTYMPMIKFASNGWRVRFGMRFGERWYEVREAPINASRGFDPVELIDPYAR